MNRVVLHGHFYQPPREEPWLEEVPQERSAAPDHDWNARITRECYAPLAAAPVLDAEGRIREVINAYAWCSFNVGPTLLRWLDHHAPAVVTAMLAGDRASAARVGRGNAIAMPYHHVILPLASERDKRTEVRWGIRDFTRRFGRAPEGMWLPETAVDGATLQVLAEEGIRFTVLAPHQVPTLPAHGGAGRWHGAAGASLTVFTYDGALAHDVAFGTLMQDAELWAARLTERSDGITALATDGETFGHHHAFGDLALAAVIDRVGRPDPARLTNFAALLDEVAEGPEVEVVEPSAWSCTHGVERWRMNCGCRFDPDTSQAWRTPLRVGLEVVAQGIHAVVEREWPAEAGDPWSARDAAGPDLDGMTGLDDAARALLEAERHALAMFTSCAWFFDDLGRIEPRLVLRHAARALEFLPALEADALATTLRGALRQAASRDPAKGTGEQIWDRDVLPGADGPARLAAGLAAVRELDPALLPQVELPTHDWTITPEAIVTIHRRTRRRRAFRATAVVPGVVASRVHVRPLEGGASWVVGLADLPEAVRATLRSRAVPLVLAATLPVQDGEQLRQGLLTLEAARAAALESAWALLAREGLERAHAVLHGVLDLWALEGLAVPEPARAMAFRLLRAAPPSMARDALAERLGLALPPG